MRLSADGQVRQCQEHIGVKTLFIEPGSPWENGYNESFNGKLRNEFLNRELLFTLKEAQIVIENWRRKYNLKIADWAQADSVFESINLWDRLRQSPITFSSTSPSGRGQGRQLQTDGRKVRQREIRRTVTGMKKSTSSN
jgi:hypothetical protein